MTARKATALKVMKGTARPDRLNTDEPVANVGPATPPDRLSERAIEIFQEYTSIILRMGIASLDDVGSDRDRIGSDHAEGTEGI